MEQNQSAPARCGWCLAHPLALRYHDEEWGWPLHDDRRHFEYLLMEAMQCGLSWTLMLQKREIFRRCFDDFDAQKVAAYGKADVERILATPGMIRSRSKVEAIIGNARGFLAIAGEFGSFDRFLWSFTDGKTLIYRSHQRGQGETRNALSDAVSAALRKRGFRYLGSITVYSHLQACGVINDHAPDCFRYAQINRAADVRVVEEDEAGQSPRE